MGMWYCFLFTVLVRVDGALLKTCPWFLHVIALTLKTQCRGYSNCQVCQSHLYIWGLGTWPPSGPVDPVDWLLANHCQDFIYRPIISPYFNSRSVIILHVSQSSLFPNQVNGWSSLWGRNVGLIQYILVMMWQDPSSWGMSHIFGQQVLRLKTNAGMETRQIVEIFWAGGSSPSVFCSFILAIFGFYVLSIESLLTAHLFYP